MEPGTNLRGPVCSYDLAQRVKNPPAPEQRFKDIFLQIQHFTADYLARQIQMFIWYLIQLFKD